MTTDTSTLDRPETEPAGPTATFVRVREPSSRDWAGPPTVTSPV